jgi:hypothetical protein
MSPRRRHEGKLGIGVRVTEEKSGNAVSVWSQRKSEMNGCWSTSLNGAKSRLMKDPIATKQSLLFLAPVPQPCWLSPLPDGIIERRHARNSTKSSLEVKA